MGITLNVTFPPMVEHFIDIIRSYVTLNIFSLPGISCLARTSYYQKLYGQIGFPAAIMLYIARNYFIAKQKLITDFEADGHEHDHEKDTGAHAKLKLEHKAKQKEGHLKSQPRHDNDDEKAREDDDVVETVDLRDHLEKINNPEVRPARVLPYRVLILHAAHLTTTWAMCSIANGDN